MNVENQLISKVLETGDWVIVTDSQITQRYLSGRNKKAFKFIQDHVSSYGETPSIDAFKSKMPNYPLAPEDKIADSLRYYCDGVRQKFKHNTITDTIEEVSDHIESLESDEAYELIKKLVIKVENEVILSDRVEVNKNTMDRLEAYNALAKSDGVTGIPGGIDRVDHVLKGYHGGELIALLGYTGVGKQVS